MENATGEEESVEAQVDVVRLTAKMLRDRFEKTGELFDCQKHIFFATVANKVEHRPEEPDTSSRIAAFLGEKSWGWRKINDLLRMSENLHPTVLRSLRNDPENNEPVLGQQHGVELSKLPKQTQVAVAKIAKARDDSVCGKQPRAAIEREAES